jgi:hypothetical protein
MATPCEHRNVRLTDTEEGYECMACGRILGHLFGRHDVYPMGVRELDHPRTGGTFTMRDGREYVVVTPSLILQGVWNSHRSTSRHLYFHVGIGHFIVLESDLLDIAEKGGGPR